MCNEITFNASTSSICRFMAGNHKSRNGLYRSRTFHCNQYRMSELSSVVSERHGCISPRPIVVPSSCDEGHHFGGFCISTETRFAYLTFRRMRKMTNRIGYQTKHNAGSKHHILCTQTVRGATDRGTCNDFNWNCEIVHADASVITEWKQFYSL